MRAHHYPTLQELNDNNDCARDQLLLLRILNTSDLSFLYMLYSTDTLVDIVTRARSLVNDEDTSLTLEELVEFEGYCKDIEAYITEENKTARGDQKHETG